MEGSGLEDSERGGRHRTWTRGKAETPPQVSPETDFTSYMRDRDGGHPNGVPNCGTPTRYL